METISTETWIAVGSICFSQFVISAILLGIILMSQLSAAKAKDWSSTTGTILMSMLEARRGSKGHMVNYPVVLYQYRVGGADYQSRKISPAWNGAALARRLLWNAIRQVHLSRCTTILKPPLRRCLNAKPHLQ